MSLIALLLFVSDEVLEAGAQPYTSERVQINERSVYIRSSFLIIGYDKGTR